MDRNWNRGGANNSSSGSNNGYTGGEKNYKQPYSGGQHNNQHNHYRKKNDFSGPEYYCKVAKPVTQLLKKDDYSAIFVVTFFITGAGKKISATHSNCENS